jgi:hypothetical protein
VVQFIVPGKIIQRIVASGLYRMGIIFFSVSHGAIGNAVYFWIMNFALVALSYVLLISVALFMSSW